MYDKHAPMGGQHDIGVSVVSKHVFEIKVGDEYIPDLKRRLKKAGISHGQLAREMGWSASQLSRSFNKPMIPTGATIARMETALRALLERKAKEAVRTGSPRAD